MRITTKSRARAAEVRDAAEHLRRTRAALAEQEQTRALALAEVERLHASAGLLAVDAPDQAAGLPRLVAEQRDRVEVAEAAIATLGTRVKAAELAYLTAEADALEADAEAARAALAKHQARTDELLAQLAEHDGAYVPERLLIAAEGRDWDTAPRLREISRGELLAQEAAAAELPVAILRALATGEDPAPILLEAERGPDAYPACVWGPEALVPAPAYLRAVERAEQLVEEARRKLAAAEQTHAERLADLEVASGRGEVWPELTHTGAFAPNPVGREAGARHLIGKAREALTIADLALAELRGETPSGGSAPSAPEPTVADGVLQGV